MAQETPNIFADTTQPEPSEKTPGILSLANIKEAESVVNNKAKEEPSTTPRKKTKKTKKKQINTPPAPTNSAPNSQPRNAKRRKKVTKEPIDTEDADLLEKMAALLENEVNSFEKRYEKQQAKREAQIMEQVAKLEQVCRTEIQNSLDTLFNQKAQQIVADTIRSGIRTDIQNSLREPFQEELRLLFERSLAPSITDSCQRMFVDVDNSFKNIISQSAQNATATDSVQQITGAVANLTNVCDVLVGTITRLASFERNMSVGGNSFQSVPVTVSPTELISNAISQQDYASAVEQAVRASDVSLLDFTLTSIQDPYMCLAQNIEQSVLIALVQQMSVTLTSELELKLSWLKPCILGMQKSSDTTVNVRVSTILQTACQTLSTASSSASPKTRDEILSMIPFIKDRADFFAQ